MGSAAAVLAGLLLLNPWGAVSLRRGQAGLRGDLDRRSRRRPRCPGTRFELVSHRGEPGPGRANRHGVGHADRRRSSTWSSGIDEEEPQVASRRSTCRSRRGATQQRQTLTLERVLRHRARHLRPAGVRRRRTATSRRSIESNNCTNAGGEHRRAGRAGSDHQLDLQPSVERRAGAADHGEGHREEHRAGERRSDGHQVLPGLRPSTGRSTT